jgi:hypothetical protein
MSGPSIDRATVWSKGSTLSPCLRSDSRRHVANCLGKITFVWRQGAAQQLRYQTDSLAKILEEEKSYEEIQISKTGDHRSEHFGAVWCGFSSITE